MPKPATLRARIARIKAGEHLIRSGIPCGGKTLLGQPCGRLGTKPFCNWHAPKDDASKGSPSPLASIMVLPAPVEVA
jgi:hypothetical protein